MNRADEVRNQAMGLRAYALLIAMLTLDTKLGLSADDCKTTRDRIVRYQKKAQTLEAEARRLERPASVRGRTNHRFLQGECESRGDRLGVGACATLDGFGVPR